VPERRSHPRRRASLSYIQIEHDNGGIILDVCERGLAMQVVRSLADEQFANVRFQLGRSRNWIETRCRVAWANDSRTTVGLELLDLSSEAHILLTHWISSIADAADRAETEPSASSNEVPTAVSGAEPETSEYLVQKPRQQSTVFEPPILTQPADDRIDQPPQRLNEAELQAPSVVLTPQVPESDRETIFPRAVADHPNRFLPIIAFVVLIAVLAVGLFGLTRYRRSARPGVKKAQNTATAVPPTIPDVKPTSAPNSAPVQVPPSPPAVSESVTGFVLQAGAMTHRDNAVALANSLQQKHFPTFVYKGNSSPFYLVMIGPYPNKEASAKIRRELRTQGIDTFVRRWPSR
jgi:cell division septation protein DedD